MPETMIERIAALQIKISRCMEDVVSLSDATTHEERQAYWAAYYRAWLIRYDLEKLLKLHYGEE